MKTEVNNQLARHIQHSQDLSIPIEQWDAARIKQRLPLYDLTSYAPPKPLDDPDFGQPNGSQIRGGVFWPNAGYVTDPALSAQNLAAAAAQYGSHFQMGTTVTEILEIGGRQRPRAGYRDLGPRPHG